MTFEQNIIIPRMMSIFSLLHKNLQTFFMWVTLLTQFGALPLKEMPLKRICVPKLNGVWGAVEGAWKTPRCGPREAGLQELAVPERIQTH